MLNYFCDVWQSINLLKALLVLSICLGFYKVRANQINIPKIKLFVCRSLDYFGEDEEDKSTASAAALNRQVQSDVSTNDVVTINVDRKSSTGSQVDNVTERYLIYCKYNSTIHRLKSF